MKNKMTANEKYVFCGLLATLAITACTLLILYGSIWLACMLVS